MLWSKGRKLLKFQYVNGAIKSAVMQGAYKALAVWYSVGAIELCFLRMVEMQKNWLMCARDVYFSPLSVDSRPTVRLGWFNGQSPVDLPADCQREIRIDARHRWDSDYESLDSKASICLPALIWTLSSPQSALSGFPDGTDPAVDFGARVANSTMKTTVKMTTSTIARTQIAPRLDRPKPTRVSCSEKTSMVLSFR